jgi:hypothetical protein
MSDGPYKTLNMSPAWKKFAELAHKPAFERDQVAATVVPALEETWREDGCAETVRALRKILGDGVQTSMFEKQRAVDLEAAQRELSAGSLMRRLIVDHVIQALANGKYGLEAVNEGVENALRDRARRGPPQVEEHYLRKQSSETLAGRVRKRMEKPYQAPPLRRCLAAYRELNPQLLFRNPQSNKVSKTA